MRAAALLVGLALTAATILALCQSMLVPRKSNSITVRAFNKVVPAVLEAPLPLIRNYRMQDRWLSAVAPITVLLVLVAYVVVLMLALGLVIYGVTDLSLSDSVFQSGATMTTLGLVEPVNTPSVIITFAAAFLGLVVIAVFIGYLLAIYGAFVARESGMARVAMLAGEPAWGPVLVARGHVLRLPPEEAPDAARWIDWICDTRLNSQVNPILMRFRSTSSERHWVTTMLAILDAAAIRVSLAPAEPDPHLVQLLTEGTLTLATMSVRDHTDVDRVGEVAMHNGELELAILAAVRDSPGADPAVCGLSRSDFDDAMSMITRAGAVSPVTTDQAWNRFAAIRAVYYPHAAELAMDLHAVPAPWSGPRHPSMPVQFPQRPVPMS